MKVFSASTALASDIFCRETLRGFKQRNRTKFSSSSLSSVVNPINFLFKTEKNFSSQTSKGFQFHQALEIMIAKALKTLNDVCIDLLQEKKLLNPFKVFPQFRKFALERFNDDSRYNEIHKWSIRWMRLLPCDNVCQFWTFFFPFIPPAQKNFHPSLLCRIRVDINFLFFKMIY